MFKRKVYKTFIIGFDCFSLKYLMALKNSISKETQNFRTALLGVEQCLLYRWQISKIMHESVSAEDSFANRSFILQCYSFARNT